MTPEQACVIYASAFEDVKRLSDEISRPQPENACAKVVDGEECLDRLFHAPRGPSGEFPRYLEFLEAMCPRCKARLTMLDARKDARKRFGIAKRTILRVGQRLLREAFTA